MMSPCAPPKRQGLAETRPPRADRLARPVLRCMLGSCPVAAPLRASGPSKNHTPSFHGQLSRIRVQLPSFLQHFACCDVRRPCASGPHRFFKRTSHV